MIFITLCHGLWDRTMIIFFFWKKIEPWYLNTGFFFLYIHLTPHFISFSFKESHFISIYLFLFYFLTNIYLFLSHHQFISFIILVFSLSSFQGLYTRTMVWIVWKWVRIPSKTLFSIQIVKVKDKYVKKRRYCSTPYPRQQPEFDQ